MLGLSSSYFGFQGKPVFESVKKVFEMGFETVELGAGHSPEKGVWDSVKRLRKDFPGKSYTIHGLFPTPEERTWFNASLGLTEQNKVFVENFFKVAQIVGAKVVSIHPGFTRELEWKKNAKPMDNPATDIEIPLERAWPGFFELVAGCLDLAQETGCRFAIENTPKMAMPLVFSIEDFKKAFKEFPRLGMLLDVGHALYSGRLQQLLANFSPKICQIHLHSSRPQEAGPKTDEHKPITGLEELEPLAQVRQFKEIPVIFEHGPSVTKTEILAEKALVEEFESNL